MAGDHDPPAPTPPRETGALRRAPRRPAGSAAAGLLAAAVFLIGFGALIWALGAAIDLF
jgi:hypothetical protein